MTSLDTSLIKKRKRAEDRHEARAKLIEKENLRLIEQPQDDNLDGANEAEQSEAEHDIEYRPSTRQLA